MLHFLSKMHRNHRWHIDGENAPFFQLSVEKIDALHGSPGFVISVFYNLFHSHVLMNLFFIGQRHPNQKKCIVAHGGGAGILTGIRWATSLSTRQCTAGHPACKKKGKHRWAAPNLTPIHFLLFLYIFLFFDYFFVY